MYIIMFKTQKLISAVWHLINPKLLRRCSRRLLSQLDVMNVTVDCQFTYSWAILSFFAHTCVAPQNSGAQGLIDRCVTSFLLHLCSGWDYCTQDGQHIQCRTPLTVVQYCCTCSNLKVQAQCAQGVFIGTVV